MYWLYNRIEHVLGRFCTDACVANTDSMRADIVKTRRLPLEKVVRIYNGVDTRAFTPSADPAGVVETREHLGFRPRDVIIGSVGQLLEVKGHRYLVQALPRIRAEVPHARLLIVGSGPLRGELEQLARQQGVSHDVIFAGEISDMPPVYRCLDLLVYPSIYGAFGLVVMEAMACGVPVVASSLDGTTELITPGANGVLVPPRDSRAIAEQVVALLRDPQRRARIAAAGLDRVRRHFSTEAFARQHLALYRSLVRPAQSRSASASGSRCST